MIIWLNGAFAAGKTTLAAELGRRLPRAVVFDPEQVGLLLWDCVGPNEDFQELAAWRELVVATALTLRRHHAETLVVPMALIDDAVRGEILGGLAAAGEEVLLVFLRADADVLRDRLAARAAPDAHPTGGPTPYEWALHRLAAGLAAADRQPPGTLVLRSDRSTPAELADAVLSAAGPTAAR